MTPRASYVMRLYLSASSSSRGCAVVSALIVLSHVWVVSQSAPSVFINRPSPHYTIDSSTDNDIAIIDVLIRYPFCSPTPSSAQMHLLSLIHISEPTRRTPT